MKIFAALIFSFLACESAMAHSSIAGVWVDGGKTLSIEILDNPYEAPFTARELWRSIQPDHVDSQGNRVVKTDNLEMTCSRMASAGNTVMNCEIRVSNSIITGNLGDLNFVVRGPEAIGAFRSFVDGTQGFRLKAGFPDKYGNEAFMFEANPTYQMVVGTISNYLIFE